MPRIGGKLVGEHSGGAVDAVDKAYMSGSGTVLRDHKSGTLGEMRALEAAAEKAQMYRSDEQKLTDHHQATGYANAGPVSFGQYEVGRSSLPTQANPTRVFLDQTKLGVVYPHMEGHNKIESGDPGQYDPYGMQVRAHASARSHRTTFPKSNAAARSPAVTTSVC